jgi:hypothetical protein
MATWTKSKCSSCHNVERYHGRPSCSSLCIVCGSRDGNKTVEVHWGKEKYAGSKAGTIEKFCINCGQRYEGKEKDHKC